MNVKELKLHHFRNYEQASFSFQENCIHILHGNNAQGKTNIIEAIYFLSHLRSFRIHSADAMKMKGSHDFAITASLESLGRIHPLRIAVEDKKKSLFHYQKPVRAYSSFVGICNAVLFCPDDLALFSSGPAARRRFMDMELIKLSTSYTQALNEYQKLLKMKNQALKQYPVNRSLVQVYTQSMARVSAIILANRASFVQELKTRTKKLYPFFGDVQEEVDLAYKTFVPNPGDEQLDVEGVLQNALAREIQTRTTALGIHKDDLLLTINGQPVLESASQGQKRSFLLAMKLALCDLIYEKSGQYPILLLDDVFSELDANRRRQLLEKLPRQMQIFITTTENIDTAGLERPVVKYSVKQGTLEKEEGNV